MLSPESGKIKLFPTARVTDPHHFNADPVQLPKNNADPAQKLRRGPPFRQNVPPGPELCFYVVQDTEQAGDKVLQRRPILGQQDGADRPAAQHVSEHGGGAAQLLTHAGSAA